MWPSKGEGTQKRNCKTTTQSTAERTKLRRVGRGNTHLPQRVKGSNDMTAIDCAIITHVPRGDIIYSTP